MPVNKDDIWNSEEVSEGSHFQDLYDPRPEPEYEIHYKQAVTSEDIYLQLGNKTPCTSSCEDMVIKIKLSGTELAHINLDVKPKFLDLRTPKYRLGLHLPNPVDSDKGKAQWNNDKNELTITLRNQRDYDMFNF